MVTDLFAGNIQTPPIIKDSPVILQHYLKDISDNFNNLEILTSAPNGDRQGKKGDLIVYNNGGVYTLWVNTNGSTAWSQL